MDQLEHERALRAVYREVVLALMGTFNVHEVPTEVETVAARAVAAIVLAHPCGVARPRYARGRAALLALLNEIDRSDMKSQSEHATKTEASR